MTTTDTKQPQTRLEEGDVIKVLEAHNDLCPGELLVIEEVVHTDHPDNDTGEEFNIVNGTNIMNGSALTSKVERVHTKTEYEDAYPKWGSIVEQIKDALSGIDDASYVEVTTADAHPNPDEHSGTADIDLYFQHDDGHSVHTSVRIKGRVLPLDEMD